MYNQKSDQNEFELHLLSKRSGNKLYTEYGASPRTAGQFSNQEPQVYCQEDYSGQESLALWDKEKACYVCKVPENNPFTKTNQGEEFVRCRKTYTKTNNPHEDEERSVRSRGSDADKPEKTVFKSLSFIDRYLSVWIISAMLIGVMLGYFTNISAALDTTKIDTVSLPIAIGLWLMMWPVLCKVRYELLGQILTQPGVWRQVVASLSLNWIVGPLLMTILAWITLPDLPEYRNGLVLVGVARCIAMVLIWNQLAKGHPEYCAILVAINSIMQIVLYAPLALFYLKVVSQQGGEVDINFWDVCRSVMIFLGAPFLAGIVAQYGVIYVKGKDWFNQKFIPMISPIALIALIYTILILFALQGNEVIQNIGNVVRVSIPMCLYFMVMWAGTVVVIRKMHGTYEQTITQAFTAASNNFELAIAIAVGTFGAKSKEALAATVGPLIEVPALLLLVHVALWLKKRLNWSYS